MSVLVYSFVGVFLINLGLVHNQIVFNIYPQNYECLPKEASVNVKGNETLTVRVNGDEFSEVTCSTTGSPFLSKADFTHRNDNQRPLATAEIAKPTATHNGQWICKFYIGPNYTQVPESVKVVRDGTTYTEIYCTIQVNVTGLDSEKDPLGLKKQDDSEKSTLGMDNQNFMIMIGGIVGAVVVIIIIVQTIIIIYYKKRVALRTLSHLEQRPAMRRDDRTRYSTLPMRRKNEPSCIYQSLENLRSVNNNPPPNIKNRQPMPLPHHLDDTDDEDSIYNAMLEVKLSDLKKNEKQRGGRTLSRIFTPAPPSLDTLPKRGKSKKNKLRPAPKVAKPMNTNFDDMEDYVYAGSDSGSTISRSHLGKTPTAKIDMRDNIPMAKVNSRPVPPKPVPPKPVPPKPVPPKPVPPKPSVVATGPSLGAGAPVMSELGNLLKKRNDFNARAVEQPPFEEIASPIHQQHMRPTPKDYPPQQTRAPGFRGPQDRVDREHCPWSPTKPFHHQDQPAMRAYDPRHQVPRQPIDEEKWPSETSRYPQEERLPSEPPRYPQERRPSEGRVLGRTPNMRIQESRGPPYRQLSPEMVRAPAPIVPSQMRSPPLPRKPNPVGARIRSPMAVIRPLPPPPDTDSFYEPIEDADSTDDEEWKTEELRDYHIYNQ